MNNRKLQYAREYREKNRERLRVYWKEYRRKRRIFLKENNLEEYNKLKIYEKEYAFKWQKNNKEKVKKRRKEYARKIRIETFKAYGNKCKCCGENKLEFLAIDHINGGGRKHRKELGTGGTVLYLWLRKNNYPKNQFQILCHNCNVAKSLYGICPHKNAVSTSN